jgi:hypothetical protein
VRAPVLRFIPFFLLLTALSSSTTALASVAEYKQAISAFQKSKANTVVGSAFTKDIGFRTTQKYVVSKYQKATSKKITF